MSTSRNASQQPTTLPPTLVAEPPCEEDWLSPSEIATLTPEKINERLLLLQPLISSHAAMAEKQRRPVTEVWRAILRTGLLYHYVPRRFGGLEFGMEEFVQQILPIAEVCASTAWVASVTMEHNWLAAHFPEPAQQEFFKRGRFIVAPATSNPPSRAVRVPNGFRVSGRWRFGSGVMHSNWILAMVIIDGDPAPYPYWVAFPTTEAQILDTWYVDGLAGTGSNDILAKDVFVPEHMAVSMREMENGTSPGSKLHGNPLYRIPAVPSLTLTVTPTIVGAARGAVNLFRERLLTRKIYGSNIPQAQVSSAQVRLARADLLARTSELLMRSLAGDLHDLAKRGDSDNSAARKMIVAQNAHASFLAKESVRLVQDGSGSSVHALNDPLQRIMRDVNVVASHLAHDLETLAEQYGKSLLGIEAEAASVRFY